MPPPKAVWQLLTYQDLADYRERRGFKSDAAMAFDLGVSPNSVTGWRQGLRAPSVRTQQLLVARIRGVPVKGGETAPGTEGLVKRLLALAIEVQAPSALIEAAHRLLQAEADKKRGEPCPDAKPPGSC